MKLDIRDIFEQIGNLFYAIAIEQQVKPIELGELKLLITRNWLPRNIETNGSIISDEAHFILTTMDALAASKSPAQLAFGEFARFYKLHQNIFSNELKQRILDTATEITNVFSRSGSSDHSILKALKDLLESVTKL
ncbi:MAG TPA: hypothetical protein VFU05_12225 [Cyclobacteriaceae bacterium]|nr:hypothetical protein [Cyclobacteriaceae bacterium]